MGAMSRGRGWCAALATRLLLLLNTRPAHAAFNCFSLLDESEWDLIMSHDSSESSMSLRVAGAGPEVLTCLHNNPQAIYRYRARQTILINPMNTHFITLFNVKLCDWATRFHSVKIF
jgi:hypothetical protein